LPPTTATKEQRSPDRRFEFSAKGAAFRASLGFAPGGYGKGKPASAESAIQLLVRLFQPWGYPQIEADSRLQRSLILRQSNPWGDAPG